MDEVIRQLALIARRAREIGKNLPNLALSQNGKVLFRPTAGGVTIVGLSPRNPLLEIGPMSSASIQRNFAAIFKENFAATINDFPVERSVLAHIFSMAQMNEGRMVLPRIDGSAWGLGKELWLITDKLQIDSPSPGVFDLGPLACITDQSSATPVLLLAMPSQDLDRAEKYFETASPLIEEYKEAIEKICSETLGRDISFTAKPEKWAIIPHDEKKGEIGRFKDIFIIEYREGGFQLGAPANEELAKTIEIDYGPYGPQNNMDPQFKAVMRFHQSHYRVHKLEAPFGEAPVGDERIAYGNILDEKSAKAGANFLDEEIFRKFFDQWENGLKAQIETVTGDLLDAKVMGANLLGPLVKDFALAAKVLDLVLPCGCKEVHAAGFNRPPPGLSSLAENCETFEAFFEFAKRNGEKGALGVLTRYAEPFKGKEHIGQDLIGLAGEAGLPWRKEDLAKIDDPRVMELARYHLLLLALKLKPAAEYGGAYLMVLWHQENPEIYKTIRAYREILSREDDTFIDAVIDRMVHAIETSGPDKALKGWAKSFKTRYLETGPSRERLKKILSGEE